MKIQDENGCSFIIGEYIDKGSFSKVYTLECCLTRRRLAGKFISKEKLQRHGISNAVWNEIGIHRRLRHKNIVQFLTYIELDSHIIIVLEYCSRYSMVQIIHALKTLTESEAKHFMIQVVSAVEYLHRNQIVHRDLKLGNLFVNKQFVVKLGDFGLAVAIEYEGQKRFSRCGTPNYIAPEVINGIGYSYEVDVWALGCILHTMLEGTPPFQGPNTTSTYNNIIKCQYHTSSRMNYSAQILIMSSLQVNPKLRPTIYEMKNFEFLISRDITPKPPQFDFGNAKRMSSIRTCRITNAIKPTNPFDPNELDSKEFPKSCFFKIAKYLINIKKWPESDFGEFLSEASAMKPLDWVNSWMDFSNSYGFAYTLSSSDYGIIFNDETRMLLQNKEQYVHYVHCDGSDIICQRSSIPVALNKKLKILMHCGKYMKESLIQAHERNATEMEADKEKPIVEVFKWTKGETEMVMLLTNGSIQVNFSSDHTKLILCGCTKTVTVIESANYMKTLKLDNLQSCGASVVLKQKLSVILKYVTSFLSE